MGPGRGDKEMMLGRTRWAVGLCLVPTGRSGAIPPFGMGTGKPSVPGCWPFIAQRFLSGVFLAVSNKASQPNACPLAFAMVIHPLAVLWEGLCDFFIPMGWRRVVR